MIPAFPPTGMILDDYDAGDSGPKNLDSEARNILQDVSDQIENVTAWDITMSGTDDGGIKTVVEIEWGGVPE